MSSMNFCTQFGQTDLVFGMALIESLYEQVQDESEFVVLCRDAATHEFLKSLRMPQVRALAMDEVAGGEENPARVAALLEYLHAADQAASSVEDLTTWTYLHPRSYLIGSPPSLDGESPMAVTSSGEAKCLLVVQSSGSRGARAALGSLAKGEALDPAMDHEVPGVCRDFGALPEATDTWLLDATGVSFVAHEVVVISNQAQCEVSEATIWRHGVQFTDALGRAYSWARSCDPKFGEDLNTDAFDGMQCAVTSRGVRPRFEKHAAALGLRHVELSPEWDAFFGEGVRRDVSASQPPVLAAVRMPHGSRLAVRYSDERSPVEQLRVSALVSTYAAERYIEDCMRDLVEQTIFEKGQLEIVVVDSASPESEVSVVESYMRKYPNIAYMRSPQREGVYMAWNRAARVARGAYLCNANTDDRHRRDGLEVLANALDANPGVGLVYGDCLVTKSENTRFGRALATARLAWPAFSRNCILHGCMVGPQPMWRRELHEQLGYFDARYRVAADYEMWLRFTQRTSALHVEDVLGVYLDADDGVEHANQNFCALETVAIRDMYLRRSQVTFEPGRYPYNYVEPVRAADRALQAQFPD